jgi:hypothetical protein
MKSHLGTKFYYHMLFVLLTIIVVMNISCQESYEAPPASYFLKEDSSLIFLEDNKVETIIKFLMNNYNITIVEEGLANNVVFPLQFNPAYEGKAKKLQEEIVILKRDLQKFIESGARPNLIKITQQLLERTIKEFDKERAPVLRKTIEIELAKLMKNCAEEYLNIIIPFISSEVIPDIYDLCSLIANAIVNGS